MKFCNLVLVATACLSAVSLGNPVTDLHPRVVELEDKMKNGIRLSNEESRELGQLNNGAVPANTSPVRRSLLVKRDSCPNCAKDYQCALLSCNDFCKGCDNCKCGQCGGWFWHTCYCYSNASDCE